MPENQAESQQPPAPDLMGYKSVEELVAAKRASDQEAKRLYQEAQTWKAQAEELRVNPADRMAQRKDPWQSLGEWGLPADDLRAAVQAGVQEVLQPWTRTLQARNSLMGRNPDFAKFEPEVNRWLAENPEYNERYQRDLPNAPELAMEWALQAYTLAKRSEHVPPPPGNTAEAAIPGNETGATRTVEGATPDAEAYKRAVEYGQKYDNWGPLLELRMGKTLHPEIPQR